MAAHGLRSAISGGDARHAMRKAGADKVAQSIRENIKGRVGNDYVASAIDSISFAPTYTDTEIATLREMLTTFAKAKGYSLTESTKA